MSAREIAFDLKTRTVRRGAGRFYAELLRNQRLSPEALADLQWARARAIIEHALRTTRFYPRHLGAAGLSDVRDLTAGTWSEVPVLDRTTVKGNAADLVSSEADDRSSRPALTGGSTGEPLKTRHDARVPTLALSWRMYGWWGVQPWDDLARIGRWGFGRKESVKNSLTWWPTRQRYLDAGLITPDAMRELHRGLQRNPPALVEGYVGSMLTFADFLEAEGLRIQPPRAVATTAAPLPPSARRRLEQVFGAPVYDEYRGSEAGWMAGECREQDGLHIFADTRLIEIVDDAGRPLPPGEVGDIVITDLTNRVFPLIRYRLGDRGALMEGACACGISLPRMRQPEGRTTDMLRLPGGTALGHRLMGMFADHPEAVRLFQIHQQADYSIVVRVVTGDVPDARRHVEAAVEVLRRRIDHAVPVTVEYPDSLPYTGGKTKYVISDVPSAG